MKNLFFLVFMYVAISSSAQDYLQEGKKRLNFAQTYVELGGNIYSKFSQNPSIFQSNFTIGGIHFWGHADFYVTFPLSNFELEKQPERNLQLLESSVTGARYMPLAYKKGRITPYIGASWSVFDFKQGLAEHLDAPRFSKNTIRFDGGFVIGSNSFFVRTGVNYLPFNLLIYPSSQNSVSKIELPNFYPNFSMAYSWESSRTKSMEDTNKKLNAYSTWSSPRMESNLKDGFFIGLGMSSSFRLQKSDYNEQKHPYLNKKPIAVTPDFAVGYHFTKQGLFTALSYRHLNFNLTGYGTSQQTKRQSVALEVVGYLFDYHGFTPYIGSNLSFDKLTFHEAEAIAPIEISKNKIEPGFNFGWDILPGKTRQKWVLRTNLRWYPWQTLQIEGKKHNLSQLEYNFIQLVWHPKRSNHL